MTLGALNPHRPLLVTANTQTEARGRHGRVWQSPRGGAWFSISWPSLASSTMLRAMPLVAGLALGRALSRWLNSAAAHQLRIKWPNDLLLGGAKLAGVLCERPPQAAVHRYTTPERVVVGVGINANVEPSLPDEAPAQPVTSLRAACRQTVPIAALIRHAADELSTHMRDLESFGLTPRMRSAIERSLAWRGESVALRLGAREVAGVVRGITAEGDLALETSDGLWRFDAGELVAVRPTGAPA